MCWLAGHARLWGKGRFSGGWYAAAGVVVDAALHAPVDALVDERDTKHVDRLTNHSHHEHHRRHGYYRPPPMFPACI